MKETESYKYLGDIITADGTLKETIEDRSKSCTATVAELNSILEETVSENILIDAVITYQNSIIIPKLCLNSETWTLNNTELQTMEKIHNKSLKRMLRLPQGTPSFGLRAELGILSVESIIHRRKLMFLHRLLSQPDDNITRQVMMQQFHLPGETWLNNTLALCRKLGLTEDLETIKNTSKSAWKMMINTATLNEESNQLVKWAQQSKKYTSRSLNMNKKQYIQYLPPVLATTILKVRTGMIEVKANYKNMYIDQSCRKCNAAEESLIHVLKCNTTSTVEENLLLEDAKDMLDNIEEQEPSRIKKLSTFIHLQISKLVEIPLESTPATLAASLEEDTY